MSDATSPLRSYQPFIDAMQKMDNPLLAILVAAIFTGLVQSSAATTGIVIVLAGRGFITLEAGIALAFGANIGTCITAALAAIGKPREAVQAAGAHLMFNVLGVLIWLPFIDILAGIVTSVSPAYPELEGTARLAAETPRQIANAHTFFNVANTCIFIWFTGPLAKLVAWLIPTRPEVVPRLARPKDLDPTLLDTPALAIDRIRLETMRLGRHVAEVGLDAAPAFAKGSDEEMDEVMDRARESQRLYDAISDYIRQLASADLSARESRGLAALTTVASHVENVSQTNAINLGAIGRERLEAGVTFSDETLKSIRALAKQARDAFDRSVRALEEPELAQAVIDMKPDIQRLASDAVDQIASRLTAEDPNRALVFRLETQIVEVMQREYYFAKKIAKEVIAEQEASSGEEVFDREMAEA